MTTVFSDFLRDFDDDSEGHGQVVDAIRRILVSVLRRRGIYHSGPSLLGYAGNTWDEEESILDLAHDCFDRSILQKLRGLRALLAESGSIDAAVVRNIQNFVWEKQKRHDPTGHAIFQNLKATVAELVEAEELIPIATGDAQSGTGFSGDSQYAIRGAAAGNASDEKQLREALLSSGLMFDGLQSFSTIGLSGQEILAKTIVGLKAFGIAVFSINALKKALTVLVNESRAVVPAAGRHLAAEYFEDSSGNIRTDLPGASYEETESRAYLIKEIHSEIDCSRRTAAVRDRLHRLLDRAADVWTGKDTSGEFNVEQIQSTFGVERTTVYDDMNFLGSLRERVTVRQSLAKKNGDQHG